MHIKPLHDWLVVQMDPLPTKQGAIIVLEDSSTNTVRTGTVLAVGPGKHNDKGKRTPIGIEKGEKVAFFRWNMEHKNGKQITAFLEGVGDSIGMIKASDVLFAYPASETLQLGYSG